MFEGWDSFYLLVGGGSGALIGLLFVVATLNAGADQETALRGASLYMTPVVFHFAVVLVVSGTAMAPRLGPGPAATIIGLCALGGLGHAVRIVLSLALARPLAPAHWSDIWCYGVAPGVFYLALGVAAAGLAQHAAWAADAVALAALALLLIGIRNAWDLVTWLAPKAQPPR